VFLSAESAWLIERVEMNKQSLNIHPASSHEDRRSVFSSSMIPGTVMIFDVLAIALPGTIFYLAYASTNSYVLGYYIFAISFVTAVSVILLNYAELYQIGAIMRPIERSDSVLAALITAFLFFLTIAFSLKASEIYSRVWLFGFAGTSFVAVVTCRVLLCTLFRSLSRNGIIARTMVVLGSGQQATQFLERVTRVDPYFTTVLGVYDPDHRRLGPSIAGQPVLGGVEDLIAAARNAQVDDVVVAMPWNADRDLIRAVERLKELPVNVYISSDLVGFSLAFRPALGHLQQLPMFEVVHRPISGWSYVLKSLEDYLLAALALVILSPVLILTVIAIKLDSPGPVLFKQPRLGFNNRRFDIYKFRSMYHRETPEKVVRQATKDDPRITRVGRFIRRTSIDELPQLLNVLNGSMSLVGPRPHALDHNEEFAGQVRGYFARHNIKPGITGWAQVNGLRGETDTAEKVMARVDHDTYYAENWSLLFDLRILFTTVLVLLFQKNAY
jgi:Undecaprenyl-phosphate glucose phosphotransferase